MSNITDDQIAVFVKVYKQPYAHIKIAEGLDLHQQFANELQMDRQDAKRLCHQINYTFDMRVF